MLGLPLPYTGRRNYRTKRRIGQWFWARGTRPSCPARPRWIRQSRSSGLKIFRFLIIFKQKREFLLISTEKNIFYSTFKVKGPCLSFFHYQFSPVIICSICSRSFPRELFIKTPLGLFVDKNLKERKVVRIFHFTFSDTILFFLQTLEALFQRNERKSNEIAIANSF